MILLTEVTKRIEMPLMISDGLGVSRYGFGGDATYVDDQGVKFIWRGRRQIFNVRGVAIGTTNYLEVSDLATCQATTESFFWDDPNDRLYVHHDGNANDYAIDRNLYLFLETSAGFATGVFANARSYYPTFYFDPRILSIGELTKEVDPLKFGLLSFEQSDYELSNADGRFDAFTDEEALNALTRFVLMNRDQGDIDDGTRIFTGYSGGASWGDDALRVRLSEARQFFNRDVCPNVFDTTTYASLDPRYAGKRIPVAYGDIRRGIAVPIDTDGFDKSTGGTVTFKLADDALYTIGAVDALYDSDGNSVTLGTIDLSACTVQTAIAAGADIDLDRFTWEGEGYQLTSGDYNNGLDIMREAFAEQGELPYVSTTYDTAQWAAQQVAHPEAIGLSIQSERGIIDEIVEPITVSLQGVVDVLGDGRLTFRPRTPDANVTKFYYQYKLLSAPDFDKVTDEVVSQVVVGYAPDFLRGDLLIATFAGDADRVASAYGIDRSQPLSPVRTVLFDEADALALGEEVADTSTNPQLIVSVDVALGESVPNLFEVVQIDVARSQNTARWIVCEVLGRRLSFQDNEFRVGLRLRELPDREPQFPDFIVTEPVELLLTTEAGSLLTTET